MLHVWHHRMSLRVLTTPSLLLTVSLLEVSLLTVFLLLTVSEVGLADGGHLTL